MQGIPVSTLKIDPAFISGMEPEGENAEMVQKVLALAQDAGIDVVAVGVETMEQLKRLKELKCEYGQGFFFSKPLDSDAAGALISISGLEKLVSETGKQPAPVTGLEPASTAP
jgi:EAL domain-containing protein (putative c-di-GMP-specific phosphodiesterase class I)